MDFDQELMMEAQRVPVAGTAQGAARLVNEMEDKRERQLRALRTLAQIELDLGAQPSGHRNDGPQTGR